MDTSVQRRRVHLFEGAWLRGSQWVEGEPPPEFLLNGVHYRTRSVLAVTHRDGSIGFDVEVTRAVNT